MHSVTALCAPNGLRAAIAGLVAGRLGVCACTTQIVIDERENIPRAGIGIEGLREGRHRDDSQSSRSDESLSHGSSFLIVLGARPSRFPVRRASPFLVIVASTADVAPTHAPPDRSAMFAYLLMQAGTKTFPEIYARRIILRNRGE